MCFERGGKISSSIDRSVEFLEDGTIELFCYESLSLVATVYKDGSGAYLVRVSSTRQLDVLNEGYDECVSITAASFS